LLLAAFAAAGNPRANAQADGSVKANHAATAPSSPTANLAQLFQRGQDALNRGQLDEAEHAFRQVLAADPNSGGAYANLGVVYMRRKQWTKALEILVWPTTARMNS
jgi:Tfp pilus assembly protein PilF